MSKKYKFNLENIKILCNIKKRKIKPPIPSVHTSTCLDVLMYLNSYCICVICIRHPHACQRYNDNFRFNFKTISYIGFQCVPYLQFWVLYFLFLLFHKPTIFCEIYLVHFNLFYFLENLETILYLYPLKSSLFFTEILEFIRYPAILILPSFIQ